MKTVLFVITWLLICNCICTAQNKLSFDVPINHFYFSLDGETYAAIENSEFLKNWFAVFERRTTVRTDKTYTGIYFYGTHTYFEFFDASKQTEYKQNSTGVAFGIERPEGLKELQAKLPGTTIELITRQYNDAQVPWFYMLDLEKFLPNSVLDSWVMEYHPKFLAEWHAEADGNRVGILRTQVLGRYARVLKNSPPHPLLEDVIGLTIAADSESITKMKELCETFGYRSRGDREVTVLEGPDLVLRLIPETSSARGLRQAIFRVWQKPNGKTEFVFGSHSVLRFQKDGKAVWYFE